MSNKKCSKCKQTKAFAEFTKQKDGPCGLASHCKTCRKNSSKQYYNKNKDKVCEGIKRYRASATPCLYRIKNKTTGEYYLGRTKQHLSQRVTLHFSYYSNKYSPFTGLNKKDYEWQVLCYGTLEQVEGLETQLLTTRVGIDPKCLNKRGGSNEQ